MLGTVYYYRHSNQNIYIYIYIYIQSLVDFVINLKISIVYESSLIPTEGVLRQHHILWITPKVWHRSARKEIDDLLS